MNLRIDMKRERVSETRDDETEDARTLTEDSVHMAGLGIRADDRVKLFRS